MRKIFAVLLIIGIISSLFTGCGVPGEGSTPTDDTGSGYIKVSQEKSQEIAQKFVESEATFVFDGIPETLKLTDVETLRCPSCWMFTFEFDSRHAGYGDRTGQVLAQVITPHKAGVTVMQGEVGRAVMDDTWDMLKQEIK